MIDSHAKILVVDDFSTMRRIVKLTLKQMGYEHIVEAESGDEAQTLLKEDGPFGFVVCDWNMPGLSGIELLRWMRQTDRVRDVPFVMVTAESKREKIVEAIQAGVTSYVVKPFNKQRLAEKIQAVTGRSAA